MAAVLSLKKLKAIILPLLIADMHELLKQEDSDIKIQSLDQRMSIVRGANSIQEILLEYNFDFEEVFNLITEKE